MAKRKVRLADMSAEEAAEWVQGRAVAEVLDAMGAVPPRKLAVVSFVPKNGRHNRCSVCQTAVTHANGIGHPAEVTLLGGDELRCVIIVCSEDCEGRIRDRYS